jgi:hypothetical protein
MSLPDGAEEERLKEPLAGKVPGTEVGDEESIVQETLRIRQTLIGVGELLSHLQRENECRGWEAQNLAV